MRPTFIYFLFFASILHAQLTITGKVSSSENLQGLPYVNIGIPDKGVGTVSNEEGNFELTIPAGMESDQLRFSMVGYNSYSVFIQQIHNGSVNPNSIVLKPKLIALNEVEVVNGRWKANAVGNKTQSKMIMAGFPSNALGNEMAQFVRIKKNRPTRIVGFWISVADNKIKEPAILRLNIYQEQEGLPATNILSEPIYIELPERPKRLALDLTDYDIYVEDSFFISMEWIKDYGKENLWFSAGLLGKSIYERSTSQGKWKRYKALNIGMGVELLQYYR